MREVDNELGKSLVMVDRQPAGVAAAAANAAAAATAAFPPSATLSSSPPSLPTALSPAMFGAASAVTAAGAAGGAGATSGSSLVARATSVTAGGQRPVAAPAPAMPRIQSLPHKSLLPAPGPSTVGGSRLSGGDREPIIAGGGAAAGRPGSGSGSDPRRLASALLDPAYRGIDTIRESSTFPLPSPQQSQPPAAAVFTLTPTGIVPASSLTEPRPNRARALLGNGNNGAAGSEREPVLVLRAPSGRANDSATTGGGGTPPNGLAAGPGLTMATHALAYPAGMDVPVGGDLRVRVLGARGLPPARPGLHTFVRVREGEGYMLARAKS